MKKTAGLITAAAVMAVGAKVLIDQNRKKEQRIQAIVPHKGGKPSQPTKPKMEDTQMEKQTNQMDSNLETKENTKQTELTFEVPFLDELEPVTEPSMVSTAPVAEPAKSTVKESSSFEFPTFSESTPLMPSEPVEETPVEEESPVLHVLDETPTQTPLAMPSEPVIEEVEEAGEPPVLSYLDDVESTPIPPMESPVEEPVEELVVEETESEPTLDSLMPTPEENIVEEPIEEESTPEETVVEETIVEETIVEETIPEEPVVEEPVLETIAVEETQEPEMEEVVNDEAPLEEPVVEETVVEEVQPASPTLEELAEEEYRQACEAANGPVVRVQNGLLEGLDMEDHLEFRGVPYAEPPVGNNRWKAPIPKGKWEGVYHADTFSARCPQGFMDQQMDAPVAPGEIDYRKEFYSDSTYQREDSEDCLYLNVYVPKNAEGKNLPVAVWLHGGAFNHGHGTEITMDGAAMNQEDVILVTLNYRVGIFGFMAHYLLTAEDPHHTSGNYGILDQIEALRWVHRNIASFGGDPTNVTLFGQSAGAMSVQTIVESDLSVGLVNKAILQSGGSYGMTLFNDMVLDDAERMGMIFQNMMGSRNLLQMRSLSTEEVMAHVPEFLALMAENNISLCWQPVIDKYVLKGTMNELMDSGHILNIPYMIGTTANDITYSVEQKEAGEPTPLYNGALAFSHQLKKLGGNPAWVYFFAHPLPGDDCGAWHSSELWYMFGTLHRCWRDFTSQDETLSSTMVKYWTNFMKNSDPNGEGLPVWIPSDQASDVHTFD